VNDLIAGSQPLSNLATLDANLGVNPTISLENTAEPAANSLTGTQTPAVYNPQTDSIQWNTGLVDYGVDYEDQSAPQTLFHEYDHAFYDATSATSSVLSPTMSATIGGVTYTWTMYTTPSVSMMGEAS
jgi:hypothetical protein